MSEASQPVDYTLGTPHPTQQGYASFETKPPNYSRSGKRDSGAGYERWRSYEFRPETKGSEKEDVYVAHHRLLAVVACYPEDMPIEEILDHLRGREVHHNCPDVEKNWGIPWDNRHDAIEPVGKGEHAKITQSQTEITNAEKRAWAEDARRKGVSDAQPLGSEGAEGCRRCDSDGTLATSDGYDGKRCLDCAMEESDGNPIEVIG